MPGELLIVTGPPGAGKSTVAARARRRAAARASSSRATPSSRFLREGRIDPWLVESHAQNEIVTEAAAAAPDASPATSGPSTTASSGRGSCRRSWPPPDSTPPTTSCCCRRVERCVERVATRIGHGFADAAATRHMHDQFARATIDRSARAARSARRRRRRGRAGRSTGSATARCRLSVSTRSSPASPSIRPRRRAHDRRVRFLFTTLPGTGHLLPAAAGRPRSAPPPATTWRSRHRRRWARDRRRRLRPPPGRPGVADRRPARWFPQIVAVPPGPDRYALGAPADLRPRCRARRHARPPPCRRRRGGPT